jgi:hypothetical protein
VLCSSDESIVARLTSSDIRGQRLGVVYAAETGFLLASAVRAPTWPSSPASPRGKVLVNQPRFSLCNYYFSEYASDDQTNFHVSLILAARNRGLSERYHR